MSYFTQFVGRPRVASIVNRFSTNGAVAYNITNLSQYGKEYASGALTANTLSTVLSVSGGGQINLLGVYTTDATNRSIRVKITLDGAVVFDATSAAITSANTGVVPIGGAQYTSAASLTLAFLQPIQFSQSLLVEIASNLTETNKLTSVINYETYA
mgnify:CR=1 FL=1